MKIYCRPNGVRYSEVPLYIEKNSTFEFQKAVALKVMVTAMSEWGKGGGKGIMESASMASDITGYTALVIRKWAFEYFSAISIFSGSLDNIDNEFIDIQLSSNRGCGIGNQSSIIHDEEFKISAREFVRSNGYKKGEPNLTAHDFKT